MADVPDWLRLQKKIFSRYVQQRLRDGGVDKKIDDVVAEMKDGTLLVDLMQIMSNTTFSGKIKPSTMRIQQVNNVAEALKFVGGHINLTKIRVQPEDLVDAKEKEVLALIFQIIIKYMKIEEEGETQSNDIREALMLWLKNKTAGYNIAIDNFTKSFHDGLIFNALVHRMRPKLVDFSSLSPENKEANLAQALDLGEKYLGIEKYVTPADIPKLDELSMIVYLSDWYHGVFLLQKQDIAARRIGKLVDLTILHDKLRAEYTAKATTLKEWVAGKITELNVRDWDDTLGGIQARLAAFAHYKEHDKSDAVARQMDTNSLYNNLALRLNNAKRPAWVPPAGTSVVELEQQFASLDEAETLRAQALYEELARQVRLHKLAKRFRSAAEKLKEWLADKERDLKKEHPINSVEDAEDVLETLGVDESELKHAQETQHADLQSIAVELAKERFEHSSEIQATLSSHTDSFAALSALASSNRTRFSSALKEQQDLNEAVLHAFADAVKTILDWLKAKKAQISDKKDAPLDAQLVEVTTELAEASSGSPLLAAAEEKEAAVVARGLQNNPYTNTSLPDLKAQWAQYTLLLSKKRALLEEQIEEAKRAGLSVEQMEEIRNNFEYFDANKNGTLSRRELKVCLQSLGEESTPKDVQQVFQDYDPSNTGTISKEAFTRLMFKQLGDTDTLEEILKSFKFLSYGKEFVLAVELASVVNDKSFKGHHVDYLTKEMGAKGDGFDHEAWTKAAYDR